MCPMNKPKATLSYQASKQTKLSTSLNIGHCAMSCNINLSTQQTTKPLTPSVSVTSTLPSASSSMSLWMLRMASKLSREFSSWQSSSSIPHSSVERKQYMRYATETSLKLPVHCLQRHILRNLATYQCNVLFNICLKSATVVTSFFQCPWFRKYFPIGIFLKSSL